MILFPLKRKTKTGRGSATAAHTNFWELPWGRVVFTRGVTNSGGTAVQNSVRHAVNHMLSCSGVHTHIHVHTCTRSPTCSHNSPPLTDIPTAFIPIPASVVIVIWYRPASLPAVLFTVRLRQLSEKEYLDVLVQERLIALLLPMNTHWIPSLMTLGMGSFTMVKEMVTGSPMLIGLLLTPPEGDTSGGTESNESFLNHNLHCLSSKVTSLLLCSQYESVIIHPISPPKVVTFKVAILPHPIV